MKSRSVVLGATLALVLLGCAPTGGRRSGGSSSGTASESSSDAATAGDGAGVPTADLVVPGADTDDTADPPAETCSAPFGTGSLSGSVGGEVLSATRSAGAPVQLFGLDGFMIGFSTKDGTCATAKALGITATLMIQLCDVSVGVHDLEDDCLDDDDDGGGFGLALSNSIGIPAPGSDIDATSGSVTIEAFDTACGGAVRGSFTADFDGETVTGSFDTVSCALIKL